MVYTVHGILQARILEWVTFPFSRGSPQPNHINKYVFFDFHLILSGDFFPMPLTHLQNMTLCDIIIIILEYFEPSSFKMYDVILIIEVIEMWQDYIGERKECGKKLYKKFL